MQRAGRCCCCEQAAGGGGTAEYGAERAPDREGQRMNPTEYQLDALRELINIGVGRAAKVLSEMVNARIILQVPFIKLLTPENLRREMGHLGEGLLAAVRLGFKGPFSGTAALVFPSDSASKL